MDYYLIADFSQLCGRLVVFAVFGVNLVKFIKTKGLKKHRKSTDLRESHQKLETNEVSYWTDCKTLLIYLFL